MDTRKHDQTTTIAITIDVRDRLEAKKLVRQESWNSVIDRILKTMEES